MEVNQTHNQSAGELMVSNIQGVIVKEYKYIFYVTKHSNRKDVTKRAKKESEVEDMTYAT